MSESGALVLVTCGSEDEARSIARHLVEQRLAAGVQIFPIIGRTDSEFEPATGQLELTVS